MAENDAPENDPATTPPEPEQHAQVLTGEEEGVALYPDQTPELLDDEEVI
jgi:hypothetical protein